MIVWLVVLFDLVVVGFDVCRPFGWRWVGEAFRGEAPLEISVVIAVLCFTGYRLWACLSYRWLMWLFIMFT